MLKINSAVLIIVTALFIFLFLILFIYVQYESHNIKRKVFFEQFFKPLLFMLSRNDGPDPCAEAEDIELASITEWDDSVNLDSIKFK